MSYYLKIIKDNPIAFLPLDESTFTTAYDISGCGNNGTYNGSFSNKIMPLVYGGSNSILITDTSYVTYSTTKDFYSLTAKGGLATKDYSDNDFALEIWFKQNILTQDLNPILADSTNQVGLFYQNGNIIFKIPGQSLVYKLSFSNKAMHIVANYSIYAMELYIDGSLVKAQQLSQYSFTNSSVSFASGPSQSGNSFIIDAPAIYRKALNKEQVTNHFYAGVEHTNPSQIVSPDKGILFPLHGGNLAPVFKYEYQTEKQWKRILNDTVYYDSTYGYVSFVQTSDVQSKTFVGQDIINIPSTLSIDSSKIEWRADKGITVETSIDGTTYVQCTNGSALPQFSKETSITTNILYVRITMTSSDTSTDLPRLSGFKIYFYANKDLYAQNYGYFATSTKEYDLSLFNYPVLLRHPNVGLKTVGTGGFDIAVDQEIKTIELMFTPSTTANNILFYSTANGSYPETKLGWNGTGTLKSNISKVYINGVDKTSANIKNELVAGQPHYIVLVLTEPIKNTLQFNYLSSSNYGPACNYHNLAIYLYELTSTQVNTHYNLYVGKPSTSVSDSSFSLTESSTNYYNNQWLVVSSA
jgi:hypothetical protein